ncbi:hypothetical protein Q9233_017112 [Columba guinea]|nr:hypothetical protein Q9233_017112 [Columba guinea]
MAGRPPIRRRLAWQERPPSRPRVAWQEEVGAPQEVTSPPQPNQVDVAQPPQLDAGWLPVYQFERRHVDFIVAFLSSPEKDEEQKMEFLKCIAMIFKAATYNDLSQGLDLFCQRYELAENIKVLLEEEPKEQLPTVVRRIAMFSMAEMSFVEEVLEAKDMSLIQAHFSSIFLLLPKEEMRGLKPYLYFMTMKAVDSMLVALVLNSPASEVSEKMQDIFQMLLTFTTSERASVWERAMGRMRMLGFLLANYSSLKLFAEYLQPSERTDMVLVFIEAMTDSSTFDKEVARNVLDMVKRNSDFWLVDVPKITSLIHKTLWCINTTRAQQNMESLIVQMADKCPGEILASSDLQDEEFAPMYLVVRFLRQRRPTMLSLVLRVIMTLSERDEMLSRARKMKVMLPDLMWALQYDNKAIKVKALVVFRNVMAQLKRKEASPIAVLLEKFLLPFFDDIRLIYNPDPHRWELGNDSCPSLEQDRSRTQEYLSQSLPYLRDAQASSRESTVRFIGALLCVPSQAVQEIINQALEKLEEIQVPMADYALKSAGAAVIRSRTSPPLRTGKAKVFLYSLPVMDYMRFPELILEAENHPGNCWPFPGSQGHVFIKLSMPVIPRAVTIDHVSGTAFHGERRPPIRRRLAWQERPPSRPRVAWQEEVGAPQEVTSPPQPNQVDVAQPPQIDADSLPVNGFLRGYMDSIVSFLSSPEKEESHKIGFLMDIRDLCDTSRRHCSPRGLDVFCQRYELAENIEVLLEEEPRDQLRTALRQIAMRAIAELSAVERVLEGTETRLLQACFSSVFSLPPEVEDMDRYLYLETMRSMDNMLQALLLNSRASRVSELLQNIFQMLLTLSSSEREHVRQRAVGRIEGLSFMLAENPTLELFAEYLQPSERTDMVLVFIEAMSDSSTFGKEAARNMLDVVKGNCDFWLVDVPKITSCIHKTLGCINTAPARQSVESLIVWMADKCPGEVVSTLLTIAPPGDSTALALWEVMFSVPHTLRSVLKELLIQLRDLKSRVFCTYLEDHCLVSLAILASSDLGDQEFALIYMAFRFLKEERPAMLSLVLRGIMTLSERDEMARKMKVMLPDLMWVLQCGNKAIKIKALAIFRTVMAQLQREEASPIAVTLAGFLLPLFDDELSQLRESSISLFRDLMKMVVRNDKREMKNTVRRGLLPLYFRMSEQVQSVAKLERDRSRAQELLSQSLPYLRDAQASSREAAVRFIAIQPLEQDSEPSICSLAAQTIRILGNPREQPRSRWTLRALCCWPC